MNPHAEHGWHRPEGSLPPWSVSGRRERESQAPQAPVPAGQRTAVSFAELSPEQLYANGIAALEHAWTRNQATSAAVATAFFAAVTARALLDEAGRPRGT